MRTILATVACMSFAAMSAMADSTLFRNILGDAANIQRDAQAISQQLKSKNFNLGETKEMIAALGNDIAALRKDVESFEAASASLTPAQQKEWDLVKTKVQLLTVFYDRKAELMSAGDVARNRSMIRAHADGIAKRAEMLQQTINRLDR